jgi:hypothetical protein
MQEGFLSRRRLIFTDQQMYFECFTGHACETVRGFVTNPWMDSEMFSTFISSMNYPNSIPFFLAEYCGRELTYESDALPAFTGILNAFARKEQSVRHLKGVIIMPSNRPSFSGTIDYSTQNLTRRFAAGLCWRNAGIGRRRSMYPS